MNSTFVLEIDDAVAPSVPLICDIESFNVGPNFAPDIFGGGAGSGRGAVFNEFSVVRNSDEQSFALVSFVATGKNLETLSIVQESFEGDVFTFRRLFVFKNSIVTSLSTSGNGGAGSKETVVFTFQSISIAAQ